MATAKSIVGRSDPKFVPTRQLVVFVDIRRFGPIVGRFPDETSVLMFVDDFYTLCFEAFRAAGGALVKNVWDGCVGVFAEDASVAALDAVDDVRQRYGELCLALRVPDHGVRAGLHIGDVLVRKFGGAQLLDAMGLGVATAMSLEGDGVTITEPVYRSLPNELRGAWNKHSAKVTYRAA